MRLAAPPQTCCLLCDFSCFRQVIDSETYRPVTVHKYPAPILSLAASPTGDIVAAGMADGTLSVHRQKMQATAAAEPTRLRLGLYFAATGKR